MKKTKPVKPEVRVKINIKNTPYLIIVESPYKCKKIEKFLGFQYKCIASNGHFREISKIIPKTYEPVFEIIPLKQKHVENMREIISYYSQTPENIFIATDDDREGEAIAWHICITFELPIEKVNRIIFHEITESAIKTAVLYPLKIRMNIVLAQHARQVLDRLVGFQISPLLTKRINSSETKYLSAGRCQTPALKLIYDKEMKRNEDNKNQKQNQYQINGFFFSQNSPLKFELSKKLNSKDECVSFLEKSKEFPHELKIEPTQQKDISAPLPFNTSSLLQNANILLHLSPKETMYYCQQLYQTGYITYMRTECTKYSEMYLLKIKEYIVENYSLEYIGNFNLLQNNGNTEAHEAIRITNIYCSKVIITIGEEKEKEKEKRQKLYDLIRKRSIESCMSNYVYKQTIIKLTSPINDTYYKYILDIPVFLGWKMKIDISKDKDKDKDYGLLLFLQCAKSPINCIKIECEDYIFENNRYYTEAGLIRDLEEYGIGRPSTFSIILQTIQERNYVVKKDIQGNTIKCIDIILQNQNNDKKKEIVFIEKERIIGKEINKLVLQELGKLVIEELIPTFNDLFSYDYTKKMEIELDKISSQKNENDLIKWNDICKECDKTIKINTKQWKQEMKQIYQIDDDYELLFMKNGLVIRNKQNTDFEYKQIKKNIRIDFDKLRNKKYNLEELLEIPKEYLGDYESHPLFLKNGQYGLYVAWGENKAKISIDKNTDEITLQDIIEYLSNKGGKSTSYNKYILRVLNERISIRKGKYGNYIHYDIPGKPSQFYNVKLFPSNYLNCEINELLVWLENTYGII